MITTLLDASGQETTDPRNAATAVAQMLTGEHAGRWICISVSPEDFERIKVH